MAEPPVKKRKLDNNKSEKITKMEKTKDPEVDKIRKQLVPVLTYEEERGVELMDAHIVELLDMKQANKLLQFISDKFPLPDLHHLKRIKREKTDQGPVTVALIHPVEGFDEEKQALFDELKALFQVSDLKQFPIPRHAPLTPEQFEAQAKLWPTISRFVSHSTPFPDVFSDDEVKQMAEYMRMAIEEAKKGLQQGKTPVGCVIVSNTNELIARGHDYRPLSNNANNNNSSATTQDANALKHAAMECIRRVSRDHIVKFPTTCRDDPTGSYLCTDCTVFLTREPCPMCAMALVHSRVGCVIYGSSNEATGGLGSKYKIHCNKSFNHKYKVYKGFLKEECDKLLSDAGDLT